MKSISAIFLLLALSAPVALAKDKKPKVPAVFENARYVYVQAEEGDVINPNLFPEDRAAIGNVQDAVRDWKRYAVTLNRREADLVFIVRKGRTAAAQLHGDVGVGNQPPMAGFPNRPPGPNNPNGEQTTTGIGMQGEAGPGDDLLRVYTLTPDGKLNGPIWSREIKEGLDAPGVLLVRVLRDAVDKAYPPQSDAQPASTNKP